MRILSSQLRAGMTVRLGEIVGGTVIKIEQLHGDWATIRHDHAGIQQTIHIAELARMGMELVVPPGDPQRNRPPPRDGRVNRFPVLAFHHSANLPSGGMRYFRQFPPNSQIVCEFRLRSPKPVLRFPVGGIPADVSPDWSLPMLLESPSAVADLPLEWSELWAEMKRRLYAGDRSAVDTTKEMYWEMIGCVPPVYCFGGFLCGEAWNSATDGKAIHAMFTDADAHGVYRARYATVGEARRGVFSPDLRPYN